MPTQSLALNGISLLLAGALLAGLTAPVGAQDRLPWLRDPPPPVERSYDSGGIDRDSLPAPAEPYSSAPRAGAAPYGGGTGSGGYGSRREDTYRPPAQSGGYGATGGRSGGRDDAYRPPARYDDPAPAPRYADPYPPARSDEPEWRDDGRGERARDRYASSQPPYTSERDRPPGDDTYSMREIVDAGHGFFGSISQGLGSVIEYAFKTQGRPNGYILGEDIGGAFVAGLRYGEGKLHTRDAGTHRVFWQGPSLGYDAGAEGSKVMVLVYNMRDPEDIYQRFGGVAGSAYVVGGVGLTFQRRDDIVMAPIRAGLGLRLGANVGYLKYTRKPTWNPF